MVTVLQIGSLQGLGFIKLTTASLEYTNSSTASEIKLRLSVHYLYGHKLLSWWYTGRAYMAFLPVQSRSIKIYIQVTGWRNGYLAISELMAYLDRALSISSDSY